MTSLRAAVIGCGWIGGGGAGVDGLYTHAGAYAALDGVRLVAGCDPDAERRRAFANRWKVERVTASVDELVNGGNLDLVSVCTPDGSHAEIVARLAEVRAARAIICEKPLAGDTAAARRLVALCRQRGVSLYVNYQRRWDPAHRAVRDWIATGECGRVQAVHGYYVRGLLHNGAAWLNLLRMLIGEIVAVRALPGVEELADDPTLGAWLELANGAAATLHGLSGGDYSLFELDVMGTRGRVVLADAGRDIRRYRVEDDTDFPGFRRLAMDAPVAGHGSTEALARLVRAAIDDLVRGITTTESAEDALRDLEIVESIRASAAAGGTVMKVGRPA